MRAIFLTGCLLVCLCQWSSGQSPVIQWWYDVDDAAFGNAALADLDQDGQLEVVFSTYRNDGYLYALNTEDGSLLWKYNVGGCSDAAPLIIDADGDGDLDVILASSCVPKTFCFDGDSGYVHWVTNMRGSDSPPSAADLDRDGKLEILHGQFGGYVLCLNAEDGSVKWELAADINSWIQTAPAILDINGDGWLDFIIANWSFGTYHRIWAHRGYDHQLLWENSLPTDVMYHGASFADLDKDGKYDLTIGSYDGYVYCLDADSGTLRWNHAFPSPFYVGAPTSIGDLNKDGWDDVVYFDGWKVGALDRHGALLWSYTIPGYGQSFRGAALADMNADDTLDVVFGTSTGHLMVLHGASGAVLHDVDLAGHYGSTDFEIDHGPVVADMTGDGKLEIFVVGGHAEYPAIGNNYGRAYAVHFPGSSASENPLPWPMFRHDIRRSGHYANPLAGLPEEKDKGRQLSVYPNPTTLGSWVEWGNTDEKVIISLLDASGRLIKRESASEEHRHWITLPSAGAYVVRIETPGGVLATPLMCLPH